MLLYPALSLPGIQQWSALKIQLWFDSLKEQCLFSWTTALLTEWEWLDSPFLLCVLVGVLVMKFSFCVFILHLGNVSWCCHLFLTNGETLLASLVQYSEFRYSTYMLLFCPPGIFRVVFQGSHRIGPGLLASGSRIGGSDAWLCSKWLFPGTRAGGCAAFVDDRRASGRTK